jgi:hypothetical protein
VEEEAGAFPLDEWGESLVRWLTCWIGEDGKELLPAPGGGVDQAELLLLSELERALGLVVFALSGVGELLFAGAEELLLIGVILPELLGVVIPAAEALLLPRGMKPASEPVEAGDTSDFPVASSRGVGMVVLWFRGCWPLKRPILVSALPPA